MRTAHSLVSLLALAVAAAAQQAAGHVAPPDDALAAAWQAAKSQAKAHKAPILAFVLPSAAAMAAEAPAKRTWEREQAVGILRAFREESAPASSARDLLLRQVQLLRVTEHPRAARARGDLEVRATRSTAVFALTIPVIATPESCLAEPGETVVLLGADGKRVRGFKTELLDAAAFVAEVGAVVLEPKALAARAANVPPAIARDVAALPTAKAGRIPFVEDRDLAKRLVANLAGAAPALVQWVDGELTMHHVLWLLEDERDPLGTERPSVIEDHCTGCGMGYTPPSLTGTLKLIGP